jgi:vacuolar iron transporter family protein
MREEEVAEMIQSLQDLSYSKEESSRLAKLYSSSKENFINLMMMTELGLVVEHVSAWQIGLVNFTSFLLAGVIPLLPYILTYNSQSNVLIWSAIIGVLQLFALGYVKGVIIRGSE